MNFTVYPGFFSDYFIRASKSYVESLKLFSFYFMLAPEACLDRAQGSSPARLRGVGEEGEALQAGPAPRSPSDAQAEHGPAVPHPVHPLVPGHWAPLPPDTEGSAQLSPLPQPTQSGDGGLALRPGHGSRRGWDKGSRVGVLCSHFCASRNGPEDGVLPPSLNPPTHTHPWEGGFSRILEHAEPGPCSPRAPGLWASTAPTQTSQDPSVHRDTHSDAPQLLLPTTSPDLPTPLVNFLTSAGRAPGDPRPRVWQVVSM